MLPYIKLEYDEGIQVKKQFLSSQMLLLNLAKRIGSYRRVRKQELLKKTFLKRALRKNINHFNFVISELPLPKIEKTRIRFEREFKPENLAELKKRKTIEQELEDIQEKLKKLS
jgi:hypothetical protein